MAFVPEKFEQVIDYIDASIWHDYQICILITSASEGALPSIGLDAGVGKSTLLLRIAQLFVSKYGKCTSEEEVWDRVFNMLHSFPWELEDFYRKSPRRYFGDPVFFLYDDMQLTLGKDRSKDTYVRSLKNRLKVARTQLPVFMASAPDIGEISYPFRYLFNFEIKVPRRGIYEVQRIKKWTPFYAPYTTQASMPRQDFTVGIQFDKLPKDIEARYDKWRDERNKRFDEGEGDWKLKSIRNVLSDEAIDLLKKIIEDGSAAQQNIITYHEKGTELRVLRSCGMVEMFGDTVVPTRQARKMIKLLE